MALTIGSHSDGPLGLQLWSLRTHFDRHVADTLRLARGFGFGVVETAGTYGLEPRIFRELLDAHQLAAVSAHFGYDRFDRNLAGVIAQARILGVEYVVLSAIPLAGGTFGPAEARRAAVKFNAWSAVIRDCGLKFAYHTHGYEFTARHPGGESPLDTLAQATHPETVFLELDVFWAAQAGADPAALLAKHPGRWKLVHLKDVRFGRPPEDVAVGCGAISWPRVLAAAHAAGIAYYFIEDESSLPAENIPRSLRYLAQLGAA